MSVIFERGPQRDETPKFEIGPYKKEATIETLFSRTSGFYFD
jgi:hypothetical protein